ncbi:DUF4345 domain-containing protein [Hansschlegelia quercus]|uniref:DUF4345 domain-containing protein n=1 Tax=Hansschlegelia quercus TaxID=2528245 RepID=A0A4Q9GQK9_9HYPH|nr:DUF4345 domain-containing protein [Hansschlegelia quercus]TBN54310.1 DUF4345 domain-containing protein [Hansschlegelia quercus]
MSFFAERWAFRGIVAIAGLVPVSAGLSGIVTGAGFLDVHGPALDSHVRYLSGLLLGIGLAFWATLGRPERHSGRYRLLTAIVVLGGLARLYGVFVGDAPPAPMLFGLVMELIVTPALCLWQARLAHRLSVSSSA